MQFDLNFLLKCTLLYIDKCTLTFSIDCSGSAGVKITFCLYKSKLTCLEALQRLHFFILNLDTFYFKFSTVAAWSHAKSLVFGAFE